jgi:hypothetical protein
MSKIAASCLFVFFFFFLSFPYSRSSFLFFKIKGSPVSVCVLSFQQPVLPSPTRFFFLVEPLSGPPIPPLAALYHVGRGDYSSRTLSHVHLSNKVTQEEQPLKF